MAGYPEELEGQPGTWFDKTPARDLSPFVRAEELERITKIIRYGFGEGSGSPGEWYYERADELAYWQEKLNDKQWFIDWFKDVVKGK